MEKILSNFKIEGKVVYCELYGEGHINDTYLVKTNSNEKYILQKINNYVFKDVDKLMNNISLVTEHLTNKIISENGNPKRETLMLIKTKNNKNFYYDEVNDKFYRVYIFVTDSITLQKVENKNQFRESALAFSKFQNYLSDFDASLLYETIKDFHNTRDRFNNLVKSIELNYNNRKEETNEEILFFLQREKYVDKVIDLINLNKIPLKVTHNDTKLNNVLLDKDTSKGLCIIDLDTVMPGSVLYDFGDSIRFGCNEADEDEIDLSKVKFNIDYYESYVSGFLESSNLNSYEINNLAFSAILLTLECGMRFLTDYLSGDIYFKVKREKHNLDRCRTQIHLVKQMEEQFEQMKLIVDKYK